YVQSNFPVKNQIIKTKHRFVFSLKNHIHKTGVFSLFNIRIKPIATYCFYWKIKTKKNKGKH
ncbi:hypothetical protein NL371_26035, partial [Klebsiella pneumoniae]|nr:hypothetical protein [Klebsiella pneumoniae]